MDKVSGRIVSGVMNMDDPTHPLSRWKTASPDWHRCAMQTLVMLCYGVSQSHAAWHWTIGQIRLASGSTKQA